MYVLANIFWPFSLGPTLTSRSDDRAVNHASDRDGAGTLCAQVLGTRVTESQLDTTV